MDKPKIGLHIRREEQSRGDLSQMIMSGDRFIVRITHDGEDTDQLIQMSVDAIESRDAGPHKPAMWHVYFPGSRRAGLKGGQFVLKFDSMLHCDELPPEMFEDGDAA